MRYYYYLFIYLFIIIIMISFNHMEGSSSSSSFPNDSFGKAVGLVVGPLASELAVPLWNGLSPSAGGAASAEDSQHRRRWGYYWTASSSRSVAIVGPSPPLPAPKGGPPPPAGGGGKKHPPPPDTDVSWSGSVDRIAWAPGNRSHSAAQTAMAAEAVVLRWAPPAADSDSADGGDPQQKTATLCWAAAAQAAHEEAVGGR